MSQTNKTIVRNYVEQVVNERQLDRLEQFVAKNVVLHDAPEVTNYDALKKFLPMFLAAFPDFKVTIDDEIAEGDRVVQHWTMSGTQRGEYPGLPVTGKHAVWPLVYIYRLSSGKIAEIWGVSDQLSMLHQLGMMPAVAPSAN